MSRLLIIPWTHAYSLLLIVAMALILFRVPGLGQTSSSSSKLTQDVYPFLGVDWGGTTFIGATLPFGMVKVGPDMEDFDGRASKFGYISGGRILGFSHLHLSGAAGKYGVAMWRPTLKVEDSAQPLEFID